MDDDPTSSRGLPERMVPRFCGSGSSGTLPRIISCAEFSRGLSGWAELLLRATSWPLLLRLVRLARLSFSRTCPSADQPSLPKLPLLIDAREGILVAAWAVAAENPAGGLDSWKVLDALRRRLCNDEVIDCSRGRLGSLFAVSVLRGDVGEERSPLKDGNGSGLSLWVAVATEEDMIPG
jgi:hypothetical protein